MARRLPIDNSPTEREFQNVAKLRLNMHRDVFALPLEELTPAAFKKTLG